jgi:hypothetical protein
MTAGRLQLVHLTARIYAVLALLLGLFDLAFGVFMLATAGHAAPAGIVFVMPGFVLASLGAVLWLGAYWAAPLALVASLIPGVFPFLWYDLAAGRTPMTAWWNMPGLAAPIVFLILTMLMLVSLLRARTSTDRTHHSGPTASKVLAVVALTYGLCLMLLGAAELTARGRGEATVQLGYFLVLPGASLLALASFIWRDRIWAMIAAFAASLMPWVYPLLWMALARGQAVLDWFDITLFVVPTLFGLLVAYALLSTLARGRRNATEPAR